MEDNDTRWMREHIFLETAKLIAGFGMHDYLRWDQSFSVWVDVSDVFDWATADYELIESIEDVELLRVSLTDASRTGDTDSVSYGPALYAARRRKVRPQGAAYPKLPLLAALFDQSGPARPIDYNNPKKAPPIEVPLPEPGTIQGEEFANAVVVTSDTAVFREL